MVEVEASSIYIYIYYKRVGPFGQIEDPPSLVVEGCQALVWRRP